MDEHISDSRAEGIHGGGKPVVDLAGGNVAAGAQRLCIGVLPLTRD